MHDRRSCGISLARDPVACPGMDKGGFPLVGKKRALAKGQRRPGGGGGGGMFPQEISEIRALNPAF